MTTAQRIMLFKLFGQAMAESGIVGTAARELERERLTVKVCGRAKSWNDFNNRDVDRMKAALQAIVDPANMTAQVRQIQMPRTRLLYGLRQAADEEYIARICADKFGTHDFENLDDHQLTDLHRTICNRAFARKRREKQSAPTPEDLPSTPEMPF